MKDGWTDRLSEYLDGELGKVERSELEAHLEVCAECTATLEQLREVVARAQALEDRAPMENLWAGVAARIGVVPPEASVESLHEDRVRGLRRLGEWRVTFSLPQLVAAGIALMIIAGGTATVVSRATVAGPEAAPRDPSLVSENRSTIMGFANYDAAVAELERVIDERRDQLDTATVRVIEENLLIIDRAIGQAQRALLQDPASIYLNEHLAATMRLKLEFLQQAAQMAGAVS